MIEPDDDTDSDSDNDSERMPMPVTVIVPGATGPIPERANPTDPPVVVGIPAVKVNGKLFTRGMIARGTGIGISHISKILKGTRRPSLDNAVKLAAYFHVSTEQLLTQILPQKRVQVKLPSISTTQKPIK